jgi:D-alanyl-D-alanine dipeptidase
MLMKRLILWMAMAPVLATALAVSTVAGPFSPLLQAGYSSAAAGPLLEISSPPSMEGWSATPIKDTAEPLVPLKGLDPRVIVDPACLHPFLREGAAHRLASAARRLPPGYRLLVVDAHRSLAEQRALFESARVHFSTRYPEKSAREILEITERYVSTPSADPETPPPHTTGGAVDVAMLGLDGPLDLGPDGYRPESATGFFSGRGSHAPAHQNRRLLYTVMVEAGFTNYPQEWWHYDYGNQFWGHLSGRDAVYGLVKR